MTYIENAVPIKDIAAATKKTLTEIQTECRELGHFVGVDWRGQPAVSEVDAQSIVSGSARRVREAEAEWRVHTDACEAWATARDNAVREAQRGAELAAQRAGRGGGDAAQAGFEAAREVGVRYETTTPPPMTAGGETVAALLYTDGKRGLLGRARDILTGAPR